MRTMLLLVAGLLLFASPTALHAQEANENQTNPFRELLERMTPKARLKYERLRKAEFASLELAPRLLDPGENPERLKEPYKEGDRIYFRLLITNISIEKVTFAYIDSFQENRPVLFRDGDQVPYLSKVSKLLVQKDRNISGRSSDSVTLQPGETTAEHVDLADWYAPLQPGHYQIKDRRRFIWGGDWIDSPALTFEVVPKQNRTNTERKNGYL